MWKAIYYAPTNSSSERTLQMLKKKGYKFYGVTMSKNINVFAIKDIHIKNSIFIGSADSFEYLKEKFDSEHYIDMTRSNLLMDTE